LFTPFWKTRAQGEVNPGTRLVLRARSSSRSDRGNMPDYRYGCARCDLNRHRFVRSPSSPDSRAPEAAHGIPWASVYSIGTETQRQPHRLSHAVPMPHPSYVVAGAILRTERHRTRMPPGISAPPSAGLHTSFLTRSPTTGPSHPPCPPQKPASARLYLRPASRWSTASSSPPSPSGDRLSTPGRRPRPRCS
jgi:hypothetical protein